SLAISRQDSTGRVEVLEKLFWTAALVSPAISNARNSSSMFCKPSAHLLIRPGPLERMSVQLVVLQPRGGNMGDELLLIPPRPSPQVVVTEGIIEDLGLVEPGRMDRCEPGTPPPATGPQILLREPCCVTGIAVVDQVHALQVMMVTPESLQFFDIVHRVLRLDARRLHQAAVNDQEVQNVDRPMPGVLELPLLDRAGDRTTNRVAFQNLMVGYLIGADDAIALLGQAVGVGVAPEDLLSPLFELGIQAGRPPIASQTLFPLITVVLCFLHGILKIRDRCRKACKLHRWVWDVYCAATAEEFRRLMNEFQQWCVMQTWTASVHEMLTKLWNKTEFYVVAYSHQGCHRTSNAVDRPMNRLCRLMYANRGLHGHQGSSELRL